MTKKKTETIYSLKVLFINVQNYEKFSSKRIIYKITKIMNNFLQDVQNYEQDVQKMCKIMNNFLQDE